MLVREGLRRRVLKGRRFDVYLDSVNGNDSNTGRSAAQAVRTATAALALLSSGKKLGVARGSVFTDSLDNNGLTDISVTAYGAGARPIFACEDSLSGWTNVSGNIWKITGQVIAAVPGGLGYVTLQENGNLLQRAASSSLTAAGSYYITAESGTVDIYVLASDSGNPNTNGKLYTYSARQCGIRLGDRAKITGVETRNNLHNDGSCVVGSNSVLTDCIFRNGHKHNALWGFGSQVRYNQFLEAHYSIDNGIMGVTYSIGAVAGLPDTYIEYNTFTCRGLYARPTLCLYGHTSGANGGNNIYVRYNTFTDCFGGISAAAANIAGQVYFWNNYVTHSAGYTTLPYNYPDPLISAQSCRYNRIWFPEPYATTFTPANKLFEAGWTCDISDNVLNTGPYFNWHIGATGGAPVITAKRNVGVSFGSAFIHVQSAGATVTVGGAPGDGNVIAIPANPIELLNATGNVVTSDYNSWPGAPGFKVDNSQKTWAQWVALGYDVHSDARGDNRQAALPQGAALAGNISDWPGLACAISAADSVITQASGDVSAVTDLGRAARNTTLYAPTGTDKVSLVTVGGKPYFAPVNNGGLRTAALDLGFPIACLVAVINPTSAIVPSAAGGFVLSTRNSPNQDQGLILGGDLTASLTNEVVTGRQGGTNWWGYCDAAFNQAIGTPFVLTVWYDPVTATNRVRINGVDRGAMTAASNISTYALFNLKGFNFCFMKGEGTNGTNLRGRLGYCAVAGPTSLDRIEELETSLKTQWAIP